MSARALFEHYFDACTDVYTGRIYHPDQLDGLMSDEHPEIAASRVCKYEYYAESRFGTCSYKILIIGTVLGPVYIVKAPDEFGGQLTYKCSKELDMIMSFPDMTVTHEVMNRFFSPYGNINDWLVSVYQSLDKVM